MYLIKDAIGMIREIRGLGGGIGHWGAALNMPQIIGGLIFIWTVEGFVILATCLLTLAIAGQIHKASRFSRLVGLCHVPWLALLPWLIYRLIEFEHGMLMTIWLWYVAGTIAISLVFDVFDVWRYTKGDRVFAWAK